MKVYRDIIQGSAEWLALRMGRPTASRFDEIITAAKGDLSKSSESYINLLIGEMFVPDFEYWAGNKFTERGKELEGNALNAFIDATDYNIEIVGFCLADDGICGCSPDGLIIDAVGTPISGVEIKCPTPKEHVAYVRGGVLPDTYKQQVHGSMAVTGLDSWHFWSFFPGMQPLHVVVKRDDYTKKLEASLVKFVESYRAAKEEAFPKLKLAA